ncbi:pilus assembly protein [Paraburkholderia sp. PREW-6R]|uniref:TadE/TadG family type IV pilus assembly protein n=1 Tax=Paraburkholderia sp. PREW-6R TaxID=3141544 RepID=UPI0031F52072
MMRSLIRRCRQRAGRSGVKRFWLSDHGVAGIETAVLVPLILLMMLGFTELYLYLRTISAAERVAFTLADTIGQKPSIANVNNTASANNIGTYWYAADAIARPLDFANRGEVIITSICDSVSNNCTDPDALGKVGDKGVPAKLWRVVSPKAGANSPNQKSRLPAGFTPPAWPFYSGDSAIAVEVFYQFNPYLMTSAFWADAPGVVTVYEVVYARPRKTVVQLTSS